MRRAEGYSLLASRGDKDTLEGLYLQPVENKLEQYK
jgi:hypothetical protein